MKLARPALSLVLLVALLWPVAGCAETGGESASEGTGPMQGSALLQRVEQDAVLAVIVRLAIPFAPEGTLDAKDVRRQRAAIRRAQATLLASLEPFAVRVTARYTSSPLIALVVDRKALRYLLRSPLVRTVQENRPDPPT